jgi:hypothetical protein
VVKGSELQPGDEVAFHHHRHGKQHGTYVGRVGRHHHHVIVSRPPDGMVKHQSVHGDAIAEAKHRKPGRRQRALKDAMADAPADVLPGLVAAHARAGAQLTPDEHSAVADRMRTGRRRRRSVPAEG